MSEVIGFAGGENLVLRYQDMIKDGMIPKTNVVHIPDLAVWHPQITSVFQCKISRFSFYQTVVSDEPYLNQARNVIQNITYPFTHADGNGVGHLAQGLTLEQRVHHGL